MISDVQALQELAVNAIADGIRKYELAVANLTEEQFVEALRQAIASGDFQRHVVVEPVPKYQDVVWNGEVPIGCSGVNQFAVCVENRQAVTYLPYREVERLKARIKELETGAVDDSLWRPKN